MCVFLKCSLSPIRNALHLYSLFTTSNAVKELLCFLFLISKKNGCYLRYNADIAYELRLKYEFQVIDMAIQMLTFIVKRKNYCSIILLDLLRHTSIIYRLSLYNPFLGYNKMPICS